MKRTGVIVAIASAWLIGLWLSSLWIRPMAWQWVGLMCLVVAIAWRWIGASARSVLLIFIMLALALLRGQSYMNEERFFSVADLIGQKLSLSGRVISEPGWNEDGQYEFYMSHLGVDGRQVPGEIKVRTLVGAVREGQIVRVDGKLSKSLGRAPAQIWYAKVTVTNPVQPFPVRVKERANAGLSRVLPRDEASFIRGLLFGSRSGLPSNVEADMRATGLTHIVAVSGYNLTIIIAALATFRRRLTIGSLIATLFGIVFFILLTGAPASIVRAGVMTGLVLLIAQQRRVVDPAAALAFTVIVMSAWSPRYLLSDIGWQLSVAALAGVIFITPVLMPRKIRRHHMLWEVFISALAAQMVTFPIIIHYFGTFSLIAPLANLIVVPMIPLIMLGGFIGSGLGLVFSNQVAFLMRPLVWLVDWILALINHLASLEYASLKVRFDNDSALFAMYIVIALFVALNWRRTLKKSA